MTNEKLTVSSDRLAALQWVRALVFNLVPALGVVVALGVAWRHGISRLDIEILAVTYVLGFIGVEIGLHRYFSHASFRAHPALRVSLAILGSMAGQGSVTYWASNHRRHHKYTDRNGDPHSPIDKAGNPLGRLRGLWHAHVGWVFEREISNSTVFGKDLMRDRHLIMISRHYILWVLLGLAAPAAVGGMLTGTWMGALEGFLWGGLVRTFLVQQATFSVNSLCHTYGSRPFAMGGRATNNAWLALVTMGGSWHNNHHAFPGLATTCIRWWQIDIGGWFIRIFELLGLARDVRLGTAARARAPKPDWTTSNDLPRKEL